MFYRFELHQGDDDWNSISEVIVDAPTLETALDCLYEYCFALGDDVEVTQETDGEYSRIYSFWSEPSDDAEYDAEYGGIPQHYDFYFQEVHDTFQEALDAIPYYHRFDFHLTYEENTDAA